MINKDDLGFEVIFQLWNYWILWEVSCLLNQLDSLIGYILSKCFHEGSNALICKLLLLLNFIKLLFRDFFNLILLLKSIKKSSAIAHYALNDIIWSSKLIDKICVLPNVFVNVIIDYVVKLFALLLIFVDYWMNLFLKFCNRYFTFKRFLISSQSLLDTFF